MTGNSFKRRYYNHIKSFKNKRYKNETELSKYTWKLKEKKVEHTITWKKLRQSNTCQRRSWLCNLCIEEKVEILLSQAKPSTQLDSRFEVSTCRHMSPPTSIAPTSKPIKTEPNRPLHLSSSVYVKHSVTTCGSKCNFICIYIVYKGIIILGTAQHKTNTQYTRIKFNFQVTHYP